MKTFCLLLLAFAAPAMAQPSRAPVALFVDGNGNPFPAGTGTPAESTAPPYTCVTNVNGSLQFCDFSGSGGSSNPAKLGTVFMADGFPNSCTVGGTAYTTQLDCAWRTALATTATATSNPTVIVGTANYTTCAGLPFILPGAMGSISVNLVVWGPNSGNNAGGGTNNGIATITQTCAISTGTLSLPEVVGSAYKQLSVQGVSVDANHLAPYALQLLGQNDFSVFRDVQWANGTTGPVVVGVRFATPDGATESASLENWNIVDNCAIVNGCGGGGAVTVSLSGGVPSFTVTAGGTNYDSNTIATLVGYQNNTSNVPCSSMGTTTPVISGGAITGINSSATGCSGTVYLQLTDNHSVNYGIDFENFQDARSLSGFNIRTGNIAGLFCNGCGNDVFYSVHAWGQGLFGIQAAGTIGFVGTNCGETSLACFDNLGTAGGAHVTAVNTQYHSGTEYQGFSVFRNETTSSKFKIVELTCQETHANEFHTLALQTGPYDGFGQFFANNSLLDVEYCGQGVGNTATALQPNATFLGPVANSMSTTFNFQPSPFVSCTATAFARPPTVSGSVVTIPGDGAHNGGSIQCTDTGGTTTVQSIPSTGGTDQTFDLTTAFRASGATYVSFNGGGTTLLLNSPHVTVQNGVMDAGSGGTISATTATSATVATSATTAGGLTGGTPLTQAAFIPANTTAGPQQYFFDDFYNAVNTNTGSIGSPTGQSCVASNANAAANHPGQLLITSGTAGTGTGQSCFIGASSSGDFSLNTAPGWLKESSVLVPVLPATTAASYQFGSANGVNVSHWSTGVGFYLSSANAVPNDWYCTISSTTTDSTVAATAAWTRLTLVSDGTNLHYYINGTQVCGTGTPISTINANSMPAGAWSVTSLSTTSVTMAVDYLTTSRAVTR